MTVALFVGMTAEPVELDELVAVREDMIDIVVEMPQHYREFLIGIERCEADWNSIDLANVSRLPAIVWKLLNLDKVSKDRRAEFTKKLAAV